MSRTFATLADAILEIRRDLAKSPIVESSRVQQHTGQKLITKERIGYEYSIQPDGIPTHSEELAALASFHEFAPYRQWPEEMERWLDVEMEARLMATEELHMTGRGATETINPLLAGTIEGNWPSYTYTERLFGMLENYARILANDLTSRRCFWPIFTPADTLRAGSPTRVPCSLGYQFVVREVERVNYMNIVYLQRSCDFDRFWISDVWFAWRTLREMCWKVNQLQGTSMRDANGVRPGMFHHFITSLHSFTAGVEEIY